MYAKKKWKEFKRAGEMEQTGVEMEGSEVDRSGERSAELADGVGNFDDVLGPEVPLTESRGNRSLRRGLILCVSLQALI